MTGYFKSVDKRMLRRKTRTILGTGLNIAAASL
ncbi:hypothetical protein Godav_017440 [Gossypium davidsonii]|uniref:Uncharacterized protein n=2 Tax=Gossypium TaxID=3633 RepID=A0A7J8QUI6_GOSDV|nr:hypothetical protein [Gossypium davidsonii]MBA0639694.1 hypothetical protein [Gossypium klotzschianum]